MRSTAIAFALALAAAAAYGQGSTWQAIVDSKPAQRVNIAGFIDERHGITGGYMGATWYTEDSGATWTKAANSSLCRFGLEILDSQIAFSCGNGGDNRISLDGWKTWTSMRTYGPSEPDHFRFLSFADGKTGWIAGPATLASTRDSGATWNDLAPPADIERIAAIDLPPFGEGKIGFLLGSSGALFATQDGGATWSSKVIATQGLGLAFTNSAVFSPSAALRFTSREDGLVIAYRTDPNPAWVSLRTADAGSSWKVEEITGESGPMSSVYLSRDGRYVTLYYSRKILAFRSDAGD